MGGPGDCGGEVEGVKWKQSEDELFRALFPAINCALLVKSV